MNRKQDHQPGGDLPRLSAPAQRALASVGITRLDQLPEFGEDEIRKLHGIGPNAIIALRQALVARKMSFKTPVLVKKSKPGDQRVSTGSSPKGKSPSQEIDAIIAASGDWRGRKLSQLRKLIKQADPAVVEEVKWKKPSRPEGVPVWSHDGILCVADTLKNAVRLTFPKGAQMKDPKELFNTRLESKTVRAVDLHEGDTVDEAALRALILEAVELNSRKSASG